MKRQDKKKTEGDDFAFLPPLEDALNNPPKEIIKEEEEAHSKEEWPSLPPGIIPFVLRGLCERPNAPSTKRMIAFFAFLLGAVLCILGLWFEINGPLRDFATFIIIGSFGMLTAGNFAEAKEQ